MIAYSLAELVEIVERELNARPPLSKGYDEASRAADKQATEAMLDRIHAHLGPKDRIDDRPSWENTRVKIAGIQSTCTYGVEGALRNWCTAARKRMAA
jgi:hypothetical protein